MNLRNNETLTGLFVAATMAVVAAAIIYLSAPGVLHKRNEYYVYFENAGGIRAGTQVQLAGRKVGEVISLDSPVPLERRPEGYENLEVLVKIAIEKEAPIFNEVNVRLQPYGLLGEMLIDFVDGDETSGIAPSGASFIGERIGGLDAAAEELTARLGEMKETIENLNDLTAVGSDLRTSAANTREFTDTIKRQPWRLLWKSTKEYPGDPPKNKRKKDAERKRSDDR